MLFLLTFSASRPSICGDNEWSNSFGTKQKALGVGKGPWRQSRHSSHKRKFFVMNWLSENSCRNQRSEGHRVTLYCGREVKGSNHVKEFQKNLILSYLFIYLYLEVALVKAYFHQIEQMHSAC